jgi:hypothetical protein
VDVEPHVTIIHPRHSNLGSRAWDAVAHGDIAGTWVAHDLAVTAFDGRRWRTVERAHIG